MHWHPRGLAVYKSALLALFLALWVWAAIAPVDRFDWALENILVFLTVPPTIVLHNRLRFTPLSLGLIAVFAGLHVLGSHWSYANVPFHWATWGGRNQYDRVVHLLFGLLLFLPLRQLVQRWTKMPRAGSAIYTLSLLLALSALYEIAEWITVELAAPDLGNAFLGAQGDEFDGIKDMAMAGAGAALACAADLIAGAVRSKKSAAAAKDPVG